MKCVFLGYIDLGDDGSQCVGEFSVLSHTKEIYDDPYGEYWKRNVRIKVPKNVPARTIKRALRDTYRYSCRCTYDCCGHIFHHTIEVKHIKRREWFVAVRYGRNV